MLPITIASYASRPFPPPPATFDPLDVRPPIAAYHGLLTDPAGRYGLIPYGGTHAVTLRGEPAFIRRATNLFCSFGGDSWHPDGKGGMRRESREPTVRNGAVPNTAFLCLPLPRIRTVLQTYLYCQIARLKGMRDVVRDDEGDVVAWEESYRNEVEMEHEAEQLAAAFMSFEMEADYGVVGEYRAVDPRPYCAEYTVWEPRHEDDDTDR